MLAAEYKASLYQLRHNGDALGAIEHLVRNTLIRRCRDLLQHRGRIFQAVFCLSLRIVGRPSQRAHRRQGQTH